MTNTLAQLQQISCVRDDRALFSDLEVQLTAGEMIELRGPNGAGKSTLLRLLAGLFPDYSGEFSVAPALYVGHKPGLAAALSPLENLIWYQRFDGAQNKPAAPRAGIEQVLADVGLAGFEDQPCATLSAGQLRRVLLGRLRLARRDLWLLDEPLTALDAAGCELLRHTLESHLSAGGGVICATHQSVNVAGSKELVLGVPASAEFA